MLDEYFSGREVKDIIIAVAVLSFIFAYPEILFNPAFILMSFFIVGVAFMGHELSHRYVARRLGYFAEFRMWPQGLMFALVFALASGGSFIFAAPGAVVFGQRWAFQRPTLSDIGRIGIAGVVFNICLMLTLFGAYLFFPFPVLIMAAQINAWLAIFNLIPFGPLDGAKVLSWNPGAWLAAMVLALSGFIFPLFL